MVHHQRRRCLYGSSTRIINCSFLDKPRPGLPPRVPFLLHPHALSGWTADRLLFRGSRRSLRSRTDARIPLLGLGWSFRACAAMPGSVGDLCVCAMPLALPLGSPAGQLCCTTVSALSLPCLLRELAVLALQELSLLPLHSGE